MIGPPRRRPGEVWQGWGRVCDLVGEDCIETWELRGRDPDDPGAWDFVRSVPYREMPRPLRIALGIVCGLVLLAALIGTACA